MTLFPFSGTYKTTPRARKIREIIFYAASRATAFDNLLRVVAEETHGAGIPCFVDALTCEQAHQRGVPFCSELTQQAVEQSARLRSWGVPATKRIA
jgi:hypothetical protein